MEYILIYNANGFEVYRRLESLGPSTVMITPEVNFGNEIVLQGYRLSSKSLALASRMTIDLIWRAKERIAVSYTVFVHVVSEQGSRIVQSDAIPANSMLPTTSWRPGELVYDRHEIDIPTDAAQGDYVIWVGLYDLQSGDRLPVLDELGMAMDSQVELTWINIVND